MEADMDEALAALRGFKDGERDPDGYGGEMDGNDGARSDDYYDMDIDDAGKKEFGGGGVETPSSAHTKTPLKRTPLMERAGTPIMSNNSKNGSNSRSTKRTSVISLKDDDDDDDDYDEVDQMRMPVETPMQLRFKVRGSGGNTPGISTTSNNAAGKSAMVMMDTDEDVPRTFPQFLNRATFGRYHDALRSYVLSKRSISERKELEMADYDTAALLAGGTGPGTGGSFNTALALSSDGLAQQQSKAEIDFCKALCHIAYTADRSGNGMSSGRAFPIPSNASSASTSDQADDEGHLWNLLAVLSKLGQSALIWHDDSASMMQQVSARDYFVRDLAGRVNLTPNEIVEALAPPATTVMSTTASNQLSSKRPPPMILQRKYRLMEWIRSCLDHEKKTTGVPFSSALDGENKSLRSRNHPDSTEPVLLSEMDARTLQRLMETCLINTLQGNIKEAQHLIRSNGQSWRAAAWGGGAPEGYDLKTNDTTRAVEKIPVGNPDRFLWKRQVWKAGRSILDESLREQSMSRSSQGHVLTKNEEAAIYSLLACDVEAALQNPCLRSSWTKSLCVLLSCIWGRIEDSTLHDYNKQRRLKLRPSTFPGSQYENEENDQLQATADLAQMSDSKLLQKLESRPHLQQQFVDDDPMEVSCKAIIISFITGRSAIIESCATQSRQLLVAVNDGGDNDLVGLRLMTHLLLFLSSLDVFTASFTSSLEDIKNEVLFNYVQYLVTRPDLSHFCALYVHMLPPRKIIEFYPSVLVQVLNNGERNLIMQQIEEYMPSLMTQILKDVVRMALSTDTFGDYEGPTAVEQIKCDSLHWLLQHEEHFGDALICANMLLRDFLNDKECDKMEVAISFLHNLPDTLWELSGEIVPRYLETQENEAEKTKFISNVNNARHEHKSYSEYLEAYKIFCDWKETLNTTPPKSEADIRQHEMGSSKLNEEDQEIARYHVRRNLLKSKKEVCGKVVNVAEAAREALYNVLTFQGGWLCIDEDDDDGGDDGIIGRAGKKHAVDDEEFRRRQEIGAIRSRHLVNTVSFYNQVCEETASWLCRSLDEANSAGLTRTEIMAEMDREASPVYWYDRALDIATIVGASQYNVLTAFDQGNLQDFLSKMAEVQVLKLMNK